MKKILLLSIAIFALVSCQNEPMCKTLTNNPQMHVDLMFELDSTYKPGVYRFSDGGYNKYFVISPYGDASTSSTESHGKTTSVEEIVTQ